MRKGKGKEAKTSYCLNGLMENRCGLLVDMCLLEATGSAEHNPAIDMPHESVVLPQIRSRPIEHVKTTFSSASMRASEARQVLALSS